MMEEWAIVDEAPNYEVSDEGRVRNKRTGRVLRPQYVGRLATVTMMQDGERLVRSVPKLVRKTFYIG